MLREAINEIRRFLPGASAPAVVAALVLPPLILGGLPVTRAQAASEYRPEIASLSDSGGLSKSEDIQREIQRAAENVSAIAGSEASWPAPGVNVDLLKAILEEKRKCSCAKEPVNL